MIQEIKNWAKKYWSLVTGIVVTLGVFIYSCMMLFSNKSSIQNDIAKIDIKSNEEEVKVLDEIDDKIEENENQYHKALEQIETEHKIEEDELKNKIEKREKEILDMTLEQQALALKESLDN